MPNPNTKKEFLIEENNLLKAEAEMTRAFEETFNIKDALGTAIKYIEEIYGLESDRAIYNKNGNLLVAKLLNHQKYLTMLTEAIEAYSLLIQHEQGRRDNIKSLGNYLNMLAKMICAYSLFGDKIRASALREKHLESILSCALILHSIHNSQDLFEAVENVLVTALFYHKKFSIETLTLMELTLDAKKDYANQPNTILILAYLTLSRDKKFTFSKEQKIRVAVISECQKILENSLDLSKLPIPRLLCGIDSLELVELLGEICKQQTTTAFRPATTKIIELERLIKACSVDMIQKVKQGNVSEAFHFLAEIQFQFSNLLSEIRTAGIHNTTEVYYGQINVYLDILQEAASLFSEEDRPEYKKICLNMITELNNLLHNVPLSVIYNIPPRQPTDFDPSFINVKGYELPIEEIQPKYSLNSTFDIFAKLSFEIAELQYIPLTDKEEKVKVLAQIMIGIHPNPSLVEKYTEISLDLLGALIYTLNYDESARLDLIASTTNLLIHIFQLSPRFLGTNPCTLVFSFFNVLKEKIEKGQLTMQQLPFKQMDTCITMAFSSNLTSGKKAQLVTAYCYLQLFLFKNNTLETESNLNNPIYKNFICEIRELLNPINNKINLDHALGIIFLVNRTGVLCDKLKERMIEIKAGLASIDSDASKKLQKKLVCYREVALTVEKDLKLLQARKKLLDEILEGRSSVWPKINQTKKDQILLLKDIDSILKKLYEIVCKDLDLWLATEDRAAKSKSKKKVERPKDKVNKPLGQGKTMSKRVEEIRSEEDSISQEKPEPLAPELPQIPIEVHVEDFSAEKGWRTITNPRSVKKPPMKKNPLDFQKKHNAKQWMKEGQFEKAIPLLEKEKLSLNVFMSLVRCYENTQQQSKAENLYRKFLETSSDTQVILNFSKFLEKTGCPEKAAEVLKKISGWQHNEKILLALGKMAQSKGDHEEALGFFKNIKNRNLKELGYQQLSLSRPALEVVAVLANLSVPYYFVGSSVLNLIRNLPLFDDQDLDLLCFLAEKDWHTLIAKNFVQDKYKKELFKANIFNHRVEIYCKDTCTLAEDAAERDFSICALYYTPEGVLLNPVGGLEDFNNGILRTIRPPEEVFKNPVCILRALKYRVVWGLQPVENCEQALRNWQHDPLASGNIGNFKAKLSAILEDFSSERKILFVELLKNYGLIEKFFPIDSKASDNQEILRQLESLTRPRSPVYYSPTLFHNKLRSPPPERVRKPLPITAPPDRLNKPL